MPCTARELVFYLFIFFTLLSPCGGSLSLQLRFAHHQYAPFVTSLNGTARERVCELLIGGDTI